MRRAIDAEMSGRLIDAERRWSMVYASLALKNEEPQMQMTALGNGTRLAAQNGRFERARVWQTAAQSLSAAHADLAKGAPCTAMQAQFDIELEQEVMQAHAFPAARRIRQLIENDCVFSGRAIRAALATLAQARAEEAVQVLAAAQEACARSSRCGYTRERQIEQLLAVARPDPVLWRKAAAFWSERLAASHQLLAVEIDMVWMLAERLRASGETREALPLLQKLDRHVGQLRKALHSPPDMARFDELTRTRVQLEVASGIVVPLEETESLRGQTLLRKLTVARWTNKLADVQDADALAELQAQRQSFLELRKLLSDSPSDLPPLLRATVESILEDTKVVELGLQEAYLARLAHKKSGDPALMFDPLHPTPLSDLDRREAVYTRDEPIPDLDDAYLSWLRVPGGYVGTLLARPSRTKGESYGFASHIVNQRFIAFSNTDEALLELHRQMLQSGAGMLRGARVSAPLGEDPGGLMLGKLPLWQLPDGSLQAAANVPAGARRVTQFSTVSDALYQRLLAPFAALYQDAQRLIVSPDGALLYLPFETLSRKGVSVLETVDIDYVQSLAVYVELKKRAASRRRDGEPALLSVADPAYAKNAAPDPTTPLAALTWPPLPGTRIESQAVSRLFPQSRQLLGRDASRKTIAAMAENKDLRKMRVLHFATHGYVDDERSALVLSPGDSPVSAYLSDQDIVQWELESDLVLLSACNTGIGRRQQGEGVVGLPYAFFMAGNLNTLMSLWPVDDQGTAALIPAFVQRIRQGEDHVTALNNTKRAFARGDYGQALRNPRIWSAFVLYGVPLGASTVK